MSSQAPPSIENPEEAAKAHEILSRPHSVPRGQINTDELREAHREEIQPAPKRLADDTWWFLPGLAYCMIGADRSLFDLYSAHLGRAIDVVTHRTSAPVCLFRGADVSDNPWFHTVQGIDPKEGPGFIDFIETFEFVDNRKSLSWGVRVELTRIADPFSSSTAQRDGAWLRIVAPVCITNRRRVEVVKPAGFNLDAVELGIARIKA